MPTSRSPSIPGRCGASWRNAYRAARHRGPERLRPRGCESASASDSFSARSIDFAPGNEGAKCVVEAMNGAERSVLRAAAVAGRGFRGRGPCEHERARPGGRDPLERHLRKENRVAIRRRRDSHVKPIFVLEAIRSISSREYDRNDSEDVQASEREDNGQHEKKGLLNL